MTTTYALPSASPAADGGLFSFAYVLHCRQCPYSAEPKKLSKFQYLRLQIHLAFDDVESSNLARFINIMIIFAVFVATAELVLSTVPSLRGLGVWRHLEVVAVFFFVGEYVMRVISCRNVLRFHLSLWNLFDIMAFLPFFIEEFTDRDGGRQLRAFRLVRLARLFRVFNFPRLRTYTRILTLTVRNSYPALATFITFLVMTLTIFASIFYELEGGTYDPVIGKNRRVRDCDNASFCEPFTPFQSVPEAYWWAIQTMTAEGYGDIFPISAPGIVLTCAACIVGVLVLSVPISIVGIFFQKAVHETRSETRSIQVLLDSILASELDLTRRFDQIHKLLEANSADALARERERAMSRHRAPNKKNKLHGCEFNHVVEVLDSMVLLQLRSLRRFVVGCELTEVVRDEATGLYRRQVVTQDPATLVLPNLAEKRPSVSSSTSTGWGPPHHNAQSQEQGIPNSMSYS